MPHRCLSCSAIYADDAAEVFGGCPCGGSAFLFLRSNAPEVAPGVTSPREGSYSVDVERLLLPQEDSVAPTVDPAIAPGAREGTYDIDLQRALDAAIGKSDQRR